MGSVSYNLAVTLRHRLTEAELWGAIEKTECSVDCKLIMIIHMGPTMNGRSVRELTPLVFRSDTFKNLYELIQIIPGLAALLQTVIRVEMVIDANVVLSEIRFRLRRRNPEARSDLGEAIDSGVVIVIAPHRLISEIDDEHLSRILDGTGKTVVDARREWKNLRPKIRLYRPISEGDSALRAIDPEDVPYAVTCEETGAHAIHSRDKHLKRMGAPVVRGIPDRALRDCARSGAVVMGITVSSSVAITVTYASVRGIWSLVEKAFEGFCSLPAWTKILIVGAAVAIVAQPKFRAGVAEKWNKLRSAFVSAAPDILEVLDVFGQIATAYQEAEREAIRSKAELQAILPPPTSKTLIQHARAVCLRQEGSLPLDEILRRMKLDGYRTSSRTPRADLREALRAGGQFVVTENGEWLLSKPPVEFLSVPVQLRRQATRLRRVTNSQRLRRRRSPRAAAKIDP
jgi:hypothetical protein